MKPHNLVNTQPSRRNRGEVKELSDNPMDFEIASITQEKPRPRYDDDSLIL